MSAPSRENHRYAVRMARARIHAHAAKLRHFFQELEDRTSPNEKAAPGRTA